MELLLIDNRKQSFDAGDIVVLDNGKKYLVIYDSGNIGWHFLDLGSFNFDADIYFENSESLKVGNMIAGLGKIVEVIKCSQIQIIIQDV